NWDGEGGSPVVARTIEFAKLFAAALPARFPEPDVTVDCDGDIAFEWNLGRRRVFSVSVRRDGILNFAKLLGPSRYYGSDVIFAGVPGQIIQGIDSVAGSGPFG